VQKLSIEKMEEQRKIRGFKDLIVWQRSVALAVKIYQTTRNYPHEEIYGLTSQIRRAAVSIPSNIAVGQGKGSRPSFASHIDIAIGSAAELETQVEISHKIGYLSQSDSDSLLVNSMKSLRCFTGC
jgi:four helix bundle protein